MHEIPSDRLEAINSLSKSSARHLKAYDEEQTSNLSRVS